MEGVVQGSDRHDPEDWGTYEMVYGWRPVCRGVAGIEARLRIAARPGHPVPPEEFRAAPEELDGPVEELNRPRHPPGAAA